MAETRAGEVTFKGNPVTLVGPKLKTGEKAPDFHCVGADLATISLADTTGKARLFSVVPSLDTPVCSIQTKRFAEEMKALAGHAVAYTFSLDLPFAMARFSTASAIENLKNVSDAHDHSFGKNYGVLIEGLPIPLLARAVLVLDPSDKITYIEIVPEIAQQPDYEPALKALKAAAGV